MTYTNENQQSNNQYDNSVLEMIYKDSSESIKILRDDINSINTRLTVLIGFNSTFAGLLSKVTIQKHLSLLSQNHSDFYPYAEAILNASIAIINFLLSTKLLIPLFLVISITLAIFGVLPSDTPIVILPKKMLDKGKVCSEEEFKIAIINNRDETMQKLQNLISQKSKKLRYALLTLFFAALLSVFGVQN